MMYTDYLEHKSKNNDKNMMADQHSFEFDKIHTSTGMTCKAKIVKFLMICNVSMKVS